MEHREKVRLRKFLYSRITLALLLIIVALLLRGSIGVYKKERLTRENLEKSEIEYQELQKREEFLREETESLNTKQGIERAIRERFGLAKEGEKVIILLDEESVDPSISKKSGAGFWDWVSSFFRRD